MKLFSDIGRREMGQGLVEYGLILALVSVVAVSSLGGVGDKVTDTFHTIAPKQSTLKIDTGVMDDNINELSKDIGSLSTILPPTRSGYNFTGWEEFGDGELLGLGGFIPKRESNTLRNQDYWMDNVGVYNHMGSEGVVTHEKVSGGGMNLWNPQLENSFIRISSDSGKQYPRRGGFGQATQSSKNSIYYHVIVARIPKGYSINSHTNRVGEGSKWTWLTDREGTGRPETYIYKLETSGTGEFSTFGFIALSGNDGVPVSWDLYYAHVMNATGSDVSNSKVLLFDHTGDKSIKAKWSK